MTIRQTIDQLADRILDNNYQAQEADVAFIEQLEGADLQYLFAAASRLREQYFGRTVSLCSIVNAKSGLCTEDCAFCAQSAHHRTGVPVYPLIDREQLLEGAEKAAGYGSDCYGIITSGTGIAKGEELDKICEAVREIIRRGTVRPSCSLGIIDEETARTLASAGVYMYHHNLETAASFFPNICTTHDYQDDVETVKAVKRAGMEVCCGGIFGLGESFAQRIELLLLLRELAVDSIPVNFLDPVAGTRLEDAANLTPLDCLKTIAMCRFIVPDKKITVCGGREKNLRELQSWIFAAGANGMMTGDYLTKKGRNPDADRQLLIDLKLRPVTCAH